MTMELIEFLRARFDEDERTARMAAKSGLLAWRRDENDPHQVLLAPTESAPNAHAVVAWTVTRAKPEHIARHDPARVLADVDAKRRILDLEVPDHYDTPGEWRGWHDAYNDVLRLLALPYADHPDYREEWTP